MKQQPEGKTTTITKKRRKKKKPEKALAVGHGA